MQIIYYSGVSEYTHRFVQKLGVPHQRIPVDGTPLGARGPYLLIVPTYVTRRRSVPPQVVKFLNDGENRALLRGVIGAGNTNFNQDYCAAAVAVARKCQVPHLHNLELLGTPEDVQKVRQLIEDFTNDEKENGHGEDNLRGPER